MAAVVSVASDKGKTSEQPAPVKAAPKFLASERLNKMGIDNHDPLYAVIEPGIEPEDIDADGKYPDFFNIAVGVKFGKLARGDTIQGRAADGRWIADYVCMDAGIGFAVMKLKTAVRNSLRRVHASNDTPGYEIFEDMHDGRYGWLVRRLQTEKLEEKILQSSGGVPFLTREHARRFIHDHLLKE